MDSITEPLESASLTSLLGTKQQDVGGGTNFRIDELSAQPIMGTP